MNSLPNSGFIRLPQIIGDRRAKPPTPPVIPIKRSTLYAWVKDGRFPAPVRLGVRCSAWRVEDGRAWIENAGQKGAV